MTETRETTIKTAQKEGEILPPKVERRPWPLRWVVMAIVIYAVIHALAYLFFQKN